jgi:pyruvate/2-oxoglutarate dehydrogenase complex dihydrolipoamide acyltransferase (E2) component
VSEVPVQMPKMTMAATEGMFIEWLVADGARVGEDQPIYIVATDKVETEIMAPAAGILRHGDAVAEVDYPVGYRLGAIETDG